MPKLVCYTAIFGDIKDDLRRPHAQDDPVDFVAFTDKRSTTGHDRNGWQTWAPVWNQPDKRLQSRQHKCLPHLAFPDADYSLWLDGSLQVNCGDLLAAVETLLEDADLCVFEHCERRRVVDELQACVRLKKDNQSQMESQVSGYLAAGFPDTWGLCETGAVLRRHTPEMRQFNEAWWAEVSTKSRRDQISFPYACWKTGTTYVTFPGVVRSNPYFLFYQHGSTKPYRR